MITLTDKDADIIANEFRTFIKIENEAFESFLKDFDKKVKLTDALITL